MKSISHDKSLVYTSIGVTLLVLVVSVIYSMPLTSFLAVIPVTVLGVRHLWTLRMQRLAVGIIADAEFVKTTTPDKYLDFYVEANVLLNNHGVGYFTRYLPKHET